MHLVGKFFLAEPQMFAPGPCQAGQALLPHPQPGRANGYYQTFAEKPAADSLPHASTSSFFLISSRSAFLSTLSIEVNGSSSTTSILSGRKRTEAPCLFR